MIKVILVDAANTIIHKPLLWVRINEVLVSNGHDIPISSIREKHKFTSEIINFPDRTDERFYNSFNSEFLLSLGIIPEEKLLADLFKACTYLPWEAFSDVSLLNGADYKKAVLSNFNSGLETLLGKTVKVKFDEIIVSEIEKVRKPQVEFYESAVKKLGVLPSEIIYIGDSIKLDMIPALHLGINTLLIDREGHFPYFRNRIGSFGDLQEKINELNTKSK
jgi:putative hydrolase of the HAD superfamily